MARRSRGFTIIELLVVVSIIALLIALLLPSLYRAREQSKTLLCATNMRQMGQAVRTFALDHDNRAPGGAYIPGNGSVSWQQILNIEYFNEVDRYHTNYGIGATSSTTLSCPNWVSLPTNNGGYRAFCTTPDLDGNSPFQPDGVTPNPRFFGQIVANPKLIDPNYTSYQYGTKLERFGPYKFLMVESYYGNDSIGLSLIGDPSVNANGSIRSLLGSPPNIPPYSTSTGEISFRHPYFMKANFLFFDAHVEPLSWKNDVYSMRRYEVDQ